MRALAERAWFHGCLALGRLLRAGRYSDVRIGHEDGESSVRKRRHAHAPLVIGMGNALFAALDTGVRILPQRPWEDREREMYRRLHNTSVRIDRDGTLLLPRLPGRTLAALLDDSTLPLPQQERAIELAVIALAGFHRLDFTHGDAMAENVMVDLDAGVARWFDFETVHRPGRPPDWCRADDLRALLATCLLRTDRDRSARILGLIIDAYQQPGLIPLLATSFRSLARRSLAFHLGQAPLPLARFREIARMLTEPSSA